LAFTKENARERGLLGAEHRWGQKRVVRLDSLNPNERAVVLALIDAARASKETAPAVEKPEAVEGGRRDSADDPQAA
jgi:hypothetical protein